MVLNYLHVSIFVMNVFIECRLSVYKVKVVGNIRAPPARPVLLG